MTCNHPLSTMVKSKHSVELYRCDTCGGYRFYDGSAEEDITGWMTNPPTRFMSASWRGDLIAEVEALESKFPVGTDTSPGVIS